MDEDIIENDAIQTIGGVVVEIIPESRDCPFQRVAIELEDGRVVKVGMPGIMPIMKNDIIMGSIDVTTHRFIEMPTVIISTTRQAVIDTLKSFNIKGTNEQTYVNLYDTIQQYCNKINNNVNKPVKTKLTVNDAINKWSYEYIKQKALTVVPAEILARSKDYIWKQMLYLWHKKQTTRSLLLLGLEQRDISRSDEDPSALYKECLQNPYRVPYIDIDKARLVQKRLRRPETNEMVEMGKCLRLVYTNSFNHSHSFTSFKKLTQQIPFASTASDELFVKYKMVKIGEKVYFKQVYDRETEVVEYFARHLARPPSFRVEPVTVYTRNNENESEEIEFTDEQNEALEMALNSNVSIYTGGAGVGKSLLLRAIVEANEAAGIKYILTSFTGKAVSRIKCITRRNAYTMDFTISASLYKDVQHIIIDEMSMVSLELMSRFVRCIETLQEAPKITMVGDKNQLPPIGYGHLFRELLAIPQIPRVILTKNFRLDSEENTIMTVLQDILGRNPTIEANPPHFSIIETVDTDMSVKNIIQSFIENGYDQNDICCISPLRADALSLNEMCSSLFHPDDEDGYKQTDPDITMKNKIWRRGDAVMCLSNIYSIEVFNGDTGVITDIDDNFLYVRFNDKNEYIHSFRYTRRYENEDNAYIPEDDTQTKENELISLCLDQAYAMTVHKSQGSEYEYVIYYYSGVGKPGFICKELVYTQFSRAKVNGYLVIPIGALGELNAACRYSCSKSRNDDLSKRIISRYEEIIQEIDAANNLATHFEDDNTDDAPPEYS